MHENMEENDAEMRMGGGRSEEDREEVGVEFIEGGGRDKRGRK